MMTTMLIYTDGASRGNPGPAACAFLLVLDNKVLYEKSEFIGTTTNNVAEYRAIANALSAAIKHTKGRVKLFSDSNLAVQQINKKWKVNYPHLSKLRGKVYELSDNYEEVEFFHVKRNNPYIKRCDQLCNELLDAKIANL